MPQSSDDGSWSVWARRENARAAHSSRVQRAPTQPPGVLPASVGAASRNRWRRRRVSPRAGAVHARCRRRRQPISNCVTCHRISTRALGRPTASPSARGRYEFRNGKWRSASVGCLRLGGGTSDHSETEALPKQAYILLDVGERRTLR